MTAPACPACDGIAARQVQRVNGGLLRALWKAQFGVETGPIASTVLFECDCGVRFFSPAQAGDTAFYRGVYGSRLVRRWMRNPPEQRGDFMAAITHVKPGDRVLDVGGHGGAFRLLMPPGATCTVIDPHASEYEVSGVLKESASDHAIRLPQHYDVVCAFQVIEHVEQPVLLARQMLDCLKPGGLLVLAGPTWPSTLTRTPNMVINAPPHHITWWSPKAFRGLAERLDLTVLEARDVDGGEVLRRAYFWLSRLTPKMPPDQPFAHSWLLHARLALAAVLAPPLTAVLGHHGGPIAIDVLLVARKP